MEQYGEINEAMGGISSDVGMGDLEGINGIITSHTLPSKPESE